MQIYSTVYEDEEQKLDFVTRCWPPGSIANKANTGNGWHCLPKRLASVS